MRTTSTHPRIPPGLAFFPRAFRAARRRGAQEARGLKHGYLGTEHFLLAFLRDQQILTARLLAGLGITAEEVRASVAAVAGDGGEATTGGLAATPSAERMLEIALREARSRRGVFIGDEHILLGLIGADDAVAAQVLRAFRR